MGRNQLDERAEALGRELDAIPPSGLGDFARVAACLTMMTALERIAARQNEDPWPVLEAAFGDAGGMARALAAAAPELDLEAAGQAGPPPGAGAIGVFEDAWTSFGDATYDHSVGLVRERLRRSGFDEEFFRGKTCFDGGCGTGRLSVAMAQAGAAKVVAADLGRRSLDYLEGVARRLGLDSIEVVEQDVTDLSRWRSGTFDFVASNGVLHHTGRPERGIREHFRVTSPGGVFWLYLYGAGGLYWQAYDRLRGIAAGIPPATILGLLRWFQIREGLQYTFLDNFLAPRVYYLLDDVLALLRQEGTFTWRHARGSSEIDDTALLLATRFGREIYGPQGEVRIAVTKDRDAAPKGG